MAGERGEMAAVGGALMYAVVCFRGKRYLQRTNALYVGGLCAAAVVAAVAFVSTTWGCTRSEGRENTDIAGNVT